PRPPSTPYPLSLHDALPISFLGFDTVGHQLAQGDAKKVALILQVLEAGYEDHVLLSSDFASERETKFNGGAGYSSVTAIFLPKRSEEHTSELQSLRHLVCRL